MQSRDSRALCWRYCSVRGPVESKPRWRFLVLSLSCCSCCIILPPPIANNTVVCQYTKPRQTHGPVPGVCAGFVPADDGQVGRRPGQGRTAVRPQLTCETATGNPPPPPKNIKVVADACGQAAVRSVLWWKWPRTTLFQRMLRPSEPPTTNPRAVCPYYCIQTNTMTGTFFFL